MGQYFKVANLDKKQVIDPHEFGDGLKLMEIGCSSNGTMLGLALLLRQSTGSGGGDFLAVGAHPVVGSWAGDRVTIVGDYDKSNQIATGQKKGELWDAFEDTGEWEDISIEVVLAMCADHYVRGELANNASFKWKRDADLKATPHHPNPYPLDERIKVALWGRTPPLEEVER